MIVNIRKACSDDAINILAHLRPRDAERLGELGDPAQILYDSLNVSFSTYAGEIDGELAALWGAKVATIFDDRAYIWMLGTTLIDQHPLIFLRHSRRALRLLTRQYRFIYGQVECDFEASIKWLKWLGADLQFHEGKLAFKI